MAKLAAVEPEGSSRIETSEINRTKEQSNCVQKRGT
jgi:hypothetical protein